MVTHQIEIYHSIIQRKLLAANDFASTAELARALNDFEHHYNQIAEPFAWTFTRQKLADLLDRIESHQPPDTATTDDTHGRDPPVVALAA